MLTIISRIIQYGITNFLRNGWLSTTTVIIMVLALSVSIGLVMFNIATDQAIASVQDKIDISVYFKRATPEDQILNVKNVLETFNEVEHVDYISSDQALENFRASHEDDETILLALNELSDNPLVASLNVKARRPDQYATIAEYLTAPNLETFIDTVSYAQNQVVIERLNAIIENTNRVGLAITIIMAIVAGLMVFNTIRLAIYTSRDEIGIMRVVGASNSMVRGPFVVEGIISGILASTASIAIALPFIYFASPYLTALVPEFDLVAHFFANFLAIFAFQIAIGVSIGVLSSLVAVRRYLKN